MLVATGAMTLTTPRCAEACQEAVVSGSSSLSSKDVHLQCHHQVLVRRRRYQLERRRQVSGPLSTSGSWVGAALGSQGMPRCGVGRSVAWCAAYSTISRSMLSCAFRMARKRLLMSGCFRRPLALTMRPARASLPLLLPLATAAGRHVSRRSEEGSKASSKACSSIAVRAF